MFFFKLFFYNCSPICILYFECCTFLNSNFLLRSCYHITQKKKRHFLEIFLSFETIRMNFICSSFQDYTCTILFSPELCLRPTFTTTTTSSTTVARMRAPSATVPKGRTASTTQLYREEEERPPCSSRNRFGNNFQKIFYRSMSVVINNLLSMQ